MVKRLMEIALGLMVSLCPLQAQTLIEGTLLDAKGKAAEGYVTATERNTGNILSYADADAKGNYRLTFNAEADSLVLVASGLGFGQVRKVVANRSQRLDFRIEERALELKEVTVRAKKIWQMGDTISYNVAAYTQQGDRVIADVLKRMPGMEVTSGGGIKFNGKSISKFYIEDLDLLQGRYGQATNNVNAQDVASVQVLENHQPVKALQGKQWSDDVAINLKLKKQAKGAWAVNAMAGGGLQEGQAIGHNPLWSAEVAGMFFAKKRQNLWVYKTNNTGDDVSRELTSHYRGVNSVMLAPLCPMAALKPGGTGLPQKRTFDNHSHIVTLNHLEKLGADREAGVNIAYHHDDVRQEGNSESVLFLNNDQRMHTTETMASKTKSNELNVTARYNKNAKSNFVANVVKLEAAWNTDRVDGQLMTERTGPVPLQYDNNKTCQRFDRPQIELSNTLNVIRNIGKDAFNLHFSMGYAQRPNTLDVTVDSTRSETQGHYRQHLTSRHLAGDFLTHYRWQLGAFALNYGFAANASLRSVHTELDGWTAEDYPAANNLRYDTYEVSLRQEYAYRQSSWSATLGCPLVLYAQALNDHILHEKREHTRLFVSPNATVSYDWDHWSGKVSFRYDKTLGDPGGIYSGYVMGNYRSFQRSYVERLSESERLLTEGCIYYRNPLSATFAMLSARYEHGRNNQTYGTTYHEATSLIQAVDKPTCSATYQLRLEGSQGFDVLQTTVSLYGNYRRTTAERLIDQRVFPFRTATTQVGLRGSVTPWAWLNVAITSDFSWNESRSKSDEEKRDQTLRTATQKITITAYPTRKLTLTALLEDNYNNLTATHRHTWFGDFVAKIKLKHIELEGQANNLFNLQHYTRVNYNGLDLYSQTAQLRARHFIATVRFKLL